MKGARLVYRCRFCKNSFVMNWGRAAENMYDDLLSNPQFSRHRCADGNFGIADIIGAELDDNEHKGSD